MIWVEILLALVVIYNLLLMVIVLKKGHEQQGGISFACYTLATVAWTICTAFLQVNHDNREYLLFFIRLAHVSGVGIVISWIWFVIQFPSPSHKFHKVAWGITFAGLPWAVLAWSQWLIPDIKIIDSSTLIPVMGPLMLVYTVFLFAGMVAGAVHLGFKMKQVRGIERLQIRYVVVGGIALLGTGSLFALILPMVTNSYRYTPFCSVATIFFSTATTYAIVRYRLMDIKVVLRAALIYSVTIGGLSLSFSLLVPLLNDVLTVHLRLPSSTGSFIMAFLIALAFQPARRYVQHQVDRYLFKSVYDYRLTLREAGTALASAHDQDVLVETLINALLRTLHPSRSAVYLPSNLGTFVKLSVTGTWQELPDAIQKSNPLISYAMETDEVLLAEELLRQSKTQRAHGKRMQALGAYVLLPLIAGDQLCGIVMLGDKLSGDIYTTDDIGLLRILGKQTAIALDNARHYHDMVMMNEYHARLLHIMQDGVIALDPDERIITINSAAERITGVPAEEALTKHLDEIGLAQLSIFYTGDKALEVTVRNRDKHEIPLLVTVTPFTRHLDVSESHLIVFRDLSALRALELEKMQAERFSSMGAMAASLAHEIKNPLVPIQLFAHMLPTMYDDPEFREEFSTTVLKEVERINRLVGQMLDLVRKPTNDRRPIDMQELISRLIELINSDCLRNNINIKCTVDEYLPQVFGEEAQLYQALLNILTNAVQVMPDGGDLTITANKEGGNVVILISDTGPGVPKGELQHIFEPLFTTKVGGHGLGLALTYQFVHAHGGEIHADSQPGKGLTISITLPALCHAETEAELVCS